MREKEKYTSTYICVKREIASRGEGSCNSICCTQIRERQYAYIYTYIYVNVCVVEEDCLQRGVAEQCVYINTFVYIYICVNVCVVKGDCLQRGVAAKCGVYNYVRGGVPICIYIYIYTHM